MNSLLRPSGEIRAAVSVAVIDQALVSGANFLTGVLLARFLGLEEFGRFTLVWIVILLVNSLQHAVIVSPLMSLAPKLTDGDRSRFFGASAVHQLGFALLSLLLIFAATHAVSRIFPSWNLAGIALALGLAAAAFQIQTYVRRYYFVIGRADLALLNDFLRYSTQIAALVTLFALQGQLSTGIALWTVAATSGLAAAIALPALKVFHFDGTSFVSTSKQNWQFSRWLLGASVLNWASGNLLMIFAGGLLGPAVLGGLRAAQNLMGITHILFHAIENFAPVEAAKRFQESGAKALARYSLLLGTVGGSATVAIAIVAIAAPDMWLRLVYGAEFSEFGVYLRWYAIIYLTLFISIPLTVFIRTTERTKVIFWSQAAAAALAISAGYGMVAAFGADGVVAMQLAINFAIAAILLGGSGILSAIFVRSRD